MSDIKNILELFMDENDQFQEDLEKAEKRLKLINEWESDLTEIDMLGDFHLTPQPVKDEKIVKVKVREHNLKRNQKNHKSLF